MYTKDKISYLEGKIQSLTATLKDIATIKVYKVGWEKERMSIINAVNEDHAKICFLNSVNTHADFSELDCDGYTLDEHDDILICEPLEKLTNEGENA